MNSKIILMSALSMTLFCVGAETGTVGARNVAAQKVHRIDRAKLERVKLKKFGGLVRDARLQKGAVVVVNAQSSVVDDVLREVVRVFEINLRIKMEVEKGEFSFPTPQLKGDATLYVVDDPKLPMSLVAPEAKWTMINVAPLKTDKKPFFDQRVKKELTRGLAYLLGAADSQYPNCLTGCVTKPEDLDQFVNATTLPMDLKQRLQKYPAGLGIVPYKLVTYRDSVSQGWAATPTNAYQQAIWDEFHTLPTKPITIEPEKQ